MKPLQNVRLRGYAASLELAAEPVVLAALREDIGHGGDVTTDAIVDPNRSACARIVARTGGIVAGLSVGMLAFRLLDREVEFRARVAEGDRVEPGASSRRYRETPKRFSPLNARR